MPAPLPPENRATDALEEKYQSIFENALTGIFQTSIDGRYVSANPALARLYGYDSPEELIANIDDIENQLYVDRATRREFQARVESDGAVPSFEAQVRTRDGRVLWILETARAVRDEQGRVLFYEGTVKDITASKQAEQALRAANEMLEQRVAERTEALEKMNEELRRSLRERSTLAAAVEAAHFGVLISDPTQPDNPAIYVNPAFSRITGYGSEEVLGRNCRFLQGPETDPAQIAEMRRAIAERQPFTGLLLNYRRDGTTFWNDLAVSPVFNTEGELISFVGLQNDVTARVQAQRELEESQARYTRICANAPGMVYQFVLHPDGSISIPFASEGCRSFCGLERETIQNDAMALIRMIHPDDLTSFQSSVAGSAATLLPWKWHGRFINAEGEERWMQGGSRPERQANGDILWDGFLMDVTQLYRAQLALRESEVRKAAILEAALTGIVTTDEGGNILEANPAAERIFGYRVEEMMGANIVELFVPGRCLEAFRAGVRNFLNAGAEELLNKHLELPALRADGSEFPIELAVTAIHVEGRTFFTGHVRDITERIEYEMTLRQAKEEAERANAAKSEFLSRMSHELRTPLNAILGFSQLLQRRTLDERQRESVGFIAKAGEHLLELVNEVLDLARIEAGRTNVSLETVRLDAILQESLNLVGPAAQERQIAVTADVGGHRAIADPQRLKQVFVNLLSNAIKYNRHGGRVDICAEELADGRIALHFEDTGRGIGPEEMPRLFAPFERLDADQTVEGTGIGLAISQRLVLLMHGELTVASEPGRGSTFTVSLPAAPAHSRPVPNAELLLST